MSADIRIGTAGWTIPRACADRFGGGGSHLERYARVMKAAEINTTFYRSHLPGTWRRWAASVPPGFRFSVKTPRLLTHDQRLVDPEAGLDRFAEEVGALGELLGAVLVQTPPSLPFYEMLAIRLFKALAERFPVPVACEPRHVSWFTPEADAVMAESRIARVAADPPKIDDAAEPGGWRGFSYVRLHGSPRVYYSAYSPEILQQQAARAVALSAKGPVWVVLDNTAGSAALGDALTLQPALGF
jgi:uncharacterized protein YecE (DUF72 family)